MITTEIWKDIPGYKGLYEASNFGDIKSLEKIRKSGPEYVTTRVYPEIILKSHTTKRKYKYVVLCDNGKLKTKQVHRLIAKAFILNPDNKPEVNHKDGNPSNNQVSNLEWVTTSENGLHAYKLGLSESKTKIPISQYNLNGQLLKNYNSISEASSETGFDISDISKVIRGKRKTSKGFIWKRKEN